MTVRSTIQAQLKAANDRRDAHDSETITLAGTARTGTFEAITDRFEPQEAGKFQRERLRGVLRIDQFLADPSTFDPAVDYRSVLPARTVKPVLRGRTWRIVDAITDYDHWIIELEELRPRS